VFQVSTETGHPVVWLTEDNYKFRLSHYQQPILDWLRQSAGAGMQAGVYPLQRLHEVIAYVRLAIRARP